MNPVLIALVGAVANAFVSRRLGANLLVAWTIGALNGIFLLLSFMADRVWGIPVWAAFPQGLVIGAVSSALGFRIMYGRWMPWRLPWWL